MILDFSFEKLREVQKIVPLALSVAIWDREYEDLLYNNCLSLEIFHDKCISSFNDELQLVSTWYQIVEGDNDGPQKL